ncbi:MAG: hypothetical protein DBX66_02580 [Clostridiales bacterium]|nr:MAG: hypothetical protein DBX66_02580 [Clostridiales bacterium]RGB69804.1 hypothetical protein DW086_01340 [Harryflintia acetispora]
MIEIAAESPEIADREQQVIIGLQAQAERVAAQVGGIVAADQPALIDGCEAAVAGERQDGHFADVFDMIGDGATIKTRRVQLIIAVKVQPANRRAVFNRYKIQYRA